MYIAFHASTLHIYIAAHAPRPMAPLLRCYPVARRPPMAYRFIEQGAVDYYHAVDGYPYVRGIRTFKPTCYSMRRLGPFQDLAVSNPWRR